MGVFVIKKPCFLSLEKKELNLAGFFLLVIKILFVKTNEQIQFFEKKNNFWVGEKRKPKKNTSPGVFCGQIWQTNEK